MVSEAMTPAESGKVKEWVSPEVVEETGLAKRAGEMAPWVKALGTQKTKSERCTPLASTEEMGQERLDNQPQ